MTVPRAVVDRLLAAGCVFAELEAAVLVEAASSGGLDLDDLVRRRVDGAPLEHVVGWAAFSGLRIAVAPGVFVPRRRTEFLVRQAADLTPAGAVVLDLCCGSGAAGLAVATLADVGELHAADVDPRALACARRNIPSSRGHVHEGDLFTALPETLRGRVDVLVVNAPYVPTDEVRLLPREARDHEPRIALDGGVDGLDVHRRVAAEAADWLAPGGHVLVETSRHQARGTAAALARGRLVPRIVRGDDHDATVVIAGR